MNAVNPSYPLQKMMLVAVVTALVYCSPVFAQSGKCALTVDLNPSKAVYVADEPIEISVSFQNRGIQERAITLDYPHLDSGKLKLTPNPSLNIPNYTSASVINGPARIMKLPAGGDLSIKVFLQRFLGKLGPNRYEIRWNLAVPCAESPQRQTIEPVTGSGVLRFDVIEGQPEQLKSALQGYLSQVQKGDPSQSTEGREALLVTRSEAVIPVLEGLWKIGYLHEAIEGLKGFPRQAEARSLISRAVNSEKLAEAKEGFDVLNAWGERLPEPQVRRLMETRSAPIQIVILRYLAQSKNRDYLLLAEDYVRNSNIDVSNEAIVTRGALQTVPVQPR